MASVCTGAFVLAALGLLDRRRATTHWAHCQALATIYPKVRVGSYSVVVADGPFMTGAGISAGTDLRLPWRNEVTATRGRPGAVDGRFVYNALGGQAQFSVWAQAALPVTRSLREIFCTRLFPIPQRANHSRTRR